MFQFREVEVSEAFQEETDLLVRIRSAMQDRDQNYMLEGLIEMDEAYLGAPKREKKRGRGTERKKMHYEQTLQKQDSFIPDSTT